MTCTLYTSKTERKNQKLHFGSVSRFADYVLLLAAARGRPPSHPHARSLPIPIPDPPLFYEHKSLGVPEVRETAMNNMSVPHSVIHSSNFTNPDETEDGERKKDSGDAPKPKTGVFQKMRRRLTVTGASETIDGVAKMSVSDEDQRQKMYQAAVRCAITEYSGVSKKGYAPYNPRKKNQDALIMADDPATNTLILCVLDGHGEHGDGVSQHFRDQLAAEMISHPDWSTDVKQASADAIAKVEHQVIRNFRIDTEFSGTTLSMAIIRGNTITGVNIGDSRVIIGREENGQMVAEEFTHDHKPDSPGEKERIIASGGRVFAVEYDDGIDGPPRVWLGHMDVPGLAMSRSLGDAVAHTAGVTSDPEFTERELDPETDKFVIVATDGLWEFIENDETIELALDADSPSDSVDLLVKEANARWMREEQVIDDTTIIAAHLFGYKTS